MEKPKKLTLDYSTWRSGGDSPENKVNMGCTNLYNEYGYMCCLGQWLIQCGIPENELKAIGEPSSLKRYSIQNMLDEKEGANLFVDEIGLNTLFSRAAIEINDDTSTTPEQKISSLRDLLKENEIELEVINKPT